MTLISYIFDELFELGNFLEDHVDGGGTISLDILNARSEPPQPFSI